MEKRASLTPDLLPWLCSRQIAPNDALLTVPIDDLCGMRVYIRDLVKAGSA